MALRGWAPEPSQGAFVPREPFAAPGGRRTYRMGRGWRALLWAAALGFAGGAVAAASVDDTWAQRAWSSAAFVALAALAATGAEGMRRMRVTVDASGIEYVEWRRPRQLLLEQIRGYRTLQAKNVTYLVFEPRQPGAKALKIPRMGTMDGAFQAWLARVPDLDAADLARSEADLLGTSALGASPVERKANLGRARSFAHALNVAALAVSFWAMSYPRPYGWAVGTAFATPVLALALMLVRPGVFRLLGAKNDARPQLVMAVFLPGLAGTIRAFDVDLLAPWSLVWPALACGVLLGGAALLADRAVRRKPVWMLLLVPWFAAQSAGALTIANCFQDPSSPVEYVAEVLDKHVTRGRSGSWSLKLGPWGPRREADQVKVSADLYDRVNVGDRVRVRVRDGRLGMPWFRIVGRAP